MNAVSTALTSEERRDDRLIAGFTALAVAIHVLESAVPMPLPGVKPGLANVITLIVLLRYGWRMAAWVGMLRVLTGSLITGTFLTPTFLLSFSGATASLLVLGIAWLLFRNWLGALGYAMLGAMSHMGGQILIAFALFIPHPVVLQLAPVLMTAALGLGIVSGIICLSIFKQLPPRQT